MTNTEVESKAAFARRIDMSRQHVGRLVAAGLPTDERGQVRIAAALEWVQANLVSQASAEGAGDAAALLAARVRLTNAQADLAALSARQREGDLIERADAGRLVLGIARLQRDTILQFASRTGPELAGELGVDTRKMVAALDREMRNLLIAVTAHKLPLQTGGQHHGR